MTEAAEDASKVTAYLAGVRERYARCGRSSSLPVSLDSCVDSASDVPELLAVVDALLGGHADMPLYENVGNCGHERPPEPEPGVPGTYGPWDEWDDDHPYGLDAVGEPDERICELTETGRYCPACSKWMAETYDYDDFVAAGDCPVREAIAAALPGEGEKADCMQRAAARGHPGTEDHRWLNR
jgi:hypothetical protein